MHWALVILRSRPWTFALAAVLVALCAVSAVWSRQRPWVRQEQAVLERACAEFLEASDRLTGCVVRFVEKNGDVAERDAYFREVCESRVREKALAAVADFRYLAASAQSLREAMDLSLTLMNREYHVLRLLTSDAAVPFAPSEVRGFRLTGEELSVTWEERRRRARELVLGEDYERYKAGIRQQVANARAAASVTCGEGAR